MKVIYIAHPIGNDVEINLIKIKRIIRDININEPDVVPFAPYYVDCISLNDSVEFERNKGISNSIEIIQRGCVDELRLYGSHISKGMRNEILLFDSLKIPVKAMTHGTKSELKDLNLLYS